MKLAHSENAFLADPENGFGRVERPGNFERPTSYALISSPYELAESILGKEQSDAPPITPSTALSGEMCVRFLSRSEAP